MKKQISRRTVFKIGASALCSGVISKNALGEDDKHFFLKVFVSGGVDSSYLFDARSRKLTADGMIQNYIKGEEEPDEWVGKNGGKALATKITRPLRKYHDLLSILNGVIMTPSFEGHLQNANFLASGNPFGGDYFIPHLNRNDAPLDFVQSSFLPFSNLTNISAGVTLNLPALKGLVNSVKSLGSFNKKSALFRHLNSRMMNLGEGKGKFSAGARAMAVAHSEGPTLAGKIRGVELIEKPEVEGDLMTDRMRLADDLEMVGQLFKNNMTKSVVLSIDVEDKSVDTHGSEDAKEQEQLYSAIVDQFVAVLDFLSSTPFDSRRNMLDVTTIMFTSEFSRTLRQDGLPIDNTGTDHNPLSNSVVLCGKGIKGGVVLGATDIHDKSEEISGAHRRFDGRMIQSMGRPFDFDKQVVRSDLPNEYVASDYVNFSCVVNTLYRVFGVGKDHDRLFERNSETARVLSAVIA